MFDVVPLQQAPHVLVYERGTIVADQPPWYLEPCDDVLENEIENCYPGGLL